MSRRRYAVNDNVNTMDFQHERKLLEAISVRVEKKKKEKLDNLLRS